MRKSEAKRTTKETNIQITLNLDNPEVGEISTGIGFFDHMLTAFFKHSGFGGSILCVGDLEVDDHHTVEDIGLVLGTAFKDAIGDKVGIARFGSFYCPMDEALAFCSIDISGRPYCVYSADYMWKNIGELESDSIAEFFKAFASTSLITLHLKCLYGENDHHKCEALFKAFAHALRIAAKDEGTGLLTTKGSL